MPKKGNLKLEQLTAERDNLLKQVEALKAKETEYQKLEATLRSREHEVSALLGIEPHPVMARFDRQLRHLYVHAAVQLPTGFSTEDYVGKTTREMNTPDAVAEVLETGLQNVFSTGKEQTVESSIELPSGKYHFESRLVPEVDGDGKVESVLAITRNVTTAKMAQEALLENVDILETQHRLGQALAGELDLQKVVQFVTDAATELSGAEFGAFFYNVDDERDGMYMLYTLSGVPREAFSRFPMPRNTHLFGPTFRGEGTVRIHDVHEDPRFGQNSPYFGMPKGHLPVTSYLAVPVVSHAKEVLGGLFFGHSKPGVFTEKDERIIEGLAGQAAVAMDNARLYREARAQQTRLQITLASIGDAVIATDAEGRITFVNAVAQNLTGWTEAEALGLPLEQVFNIVNEYTRQIVENPVTRVIREKGVVGLANHTILLSKDGREIPIDDSGAPIFDEAHRLVGVILVFRDIAERRQAEQRINLLLELFRDFSQALTSGEIAEVVVNKALTKLGAHLGTVAQLVEQGTMMELLNLYGLSQEIIEKYRRTPLDFPGPLNEAVRTGEIIWISTAEEYIERYPHFAEAIKQNKTHSTICIPLRINDKIIGGFSLSFPVEKTRNEKEEEFFQALAQQCAQSLERARLYEAEQKALAIAVDAQRDLTLLAESGSILVESLNIQVTLNQIMSLIVPQMADWTHIDLLNSDNTVYRIAARHTDPEKEAALYEIARQFPVQIHAELGAGKVIRTGLVEVMSNVPKTWMKNYSRGSQHRNLVKDFNVQSYISIPLIAHGKIYGAMTFGSTQPGYFTTTDLPLLEEFTRRAAQAIANAELYQSEREARVLVDRNLRQVNRLQAATAALSESLTVDQVSKVIVEHAVEAMEASSGLLGRLVEDNTHLEIVGIQGYKLDDGLKLPYRIPLPQVSNQITSSINTRQPLWLESGDDLFPQSPFEKPKSRRKKTDVIIPLSGQQVLGVLVLTIPAEIGQDPAQRAFLIALVQQCVQAFERSQLYEQAREVAALQERQSLARDLHDSVSQTMFSASIMAESLPKVWERSQSEGSQQIQQVITLNRAAMSEMRMLLLELRPEALLNTNLPTLLGHLVAAAKGRIDIEANLEIDGLAEALPSNVHVALYRITQESINNIIKHSHATHFSVHVNRQADQIHLQVKDNGRGFDTTSPTTGLGLNSLRERAEAIGAKLDIKSTPDNGTHISVKWQT